ncbi:MAG: hypothetical protein Q8P20_04225 [bacterium]|nr:hypothetical protein [bacterium]
MQIEINKEQYKDLIMMSSIASSVFGMLGDSENTGDYKKQSLRMDGLEAHLLGSAKDFGCSELAQNDEGAVILNDEFYEDVVMPILEEYEEMQTFDLLANKLAWRDFRKEHTKNKMDKMAEQNGGYFGVEVYEYEKNIGMNLRKMVLKD